MNLEQAFEPGQHDPQIFPVMHTRCYKRTKKDMASKGGASSSAAPATPNLKSCMRQKETKTTPNIMRIAIDIGGVISQHQSGNPRKNTNWRLTRDSEVSRAMLSIRELVQRFGADNVFIISKAGPTMAKLSLTWLIDTMAIDEITGFKTEDIHVCSTLDLDQGEKE